jgi:hypothetical protein
MIVEILLNRRISTLINDPVAVVESRVMDDSKIFVSCKYFVWKTWFSSEPMQDIICPISFVIGSKRSSFDSIINFQ